MSQEGDTNPQEVQISRWDTHHHTGSTYIITSESKSGCRKWMQSGCRKWMQKVDAKGGCKKQISISIKDECMYICCVCVCSSPPGYLRHFKSIWRVWGIVAIGSAGEFSIWIETRKYPNLKPWNHKNQKRGHLGLEWYARYQKAWAWAGEFNGGLR